MLIPLPGRRIAFCGAGPGRNACACDLVRRVNEEDYRRKISSVLI